MAERLMRAHLASLQITAARLARAGLLTEELASDLAEAAVALWVVAGGGPDA